MISRPSGVPCTAHSKGEFVAGCPTQNLGAVDSAALKIQPAQDVVSLDTAWDEHATTPKPTIEVSSQSPLNQDRQPSPPWPPLESGVEAGLEGETPTPTPTQEDTGDPAFQAMLESVKSVKASIQNLPPVFVESLDHRQQKSIQQIMEAANDIDMEDAPETPHSDMPESEIEPAEKPKATDVGTKMVYDRHYHVFLSCVWLMLFSLGLTFSLTLKYTPNQLDSNTSCQGFVGMWLQDKMELSRLQRMC